MEHSTLKMDHSANLSMLEVKQQTVEDLTKRCRGMSTELSQMKKMTESPSKLEVVKLLPPFHAALNLLCQPSNERAFEESYGL